MALCNTKIILLKDLLVIMVLWYYGSIFSFSTGIVDETVILNEETVSIKDKLAFSNGLADSVKLGVLERMMDDQCK